MTNKVSQSRMKISTFILTSKMLAVERRFILTGVDAIPCEFRPETTLLKK